MNAKVRKDVPLLASRCHRAVGVVPLRENELVTWHGKLSRWVEVSTSSGKVGYVPSKYLKKV